MFNSRENPDYLAARAAIDDMHQQGTQTSVLRLNFEVQIQNSSHNPFKNIVNSVKKFSHRGLNYYDNKFLVQCLLGIR